jgi:hypothetical protein
MRAVYVPTRVMPAGVSRLEATALAGGGRGGTLTLYPADRPEPRRTPLTPAQLRGLLRQWARGVRAGEGRLRVGD